MARLASLNAQEVAHTSNQQIEGADGRPGGEDMKLTEKEVAAFRRRFLAGDKEGTLTQAAAAVAPTNEHGLKHRQQAFKGLESLGLSAEEIAKIEGGGSTDDGDDAPSAPRPGPGMLKRS